MSVESRAIIMDARRGGVLEERFCDLYGTGGRSNVFSADDASGAPPGHQESYPLLFVTMLFLGKINRWRQRAFEQAECLRCVYFIAWDREACGFDGGARTFSGTAALAMSGRA